MAEEISRKWMKIASRNGSRHQIRKYRLGGIERHEHLKEISGDSIWRSEISVAKA